MHSKMISKVLLLALINNSRSLRVIPVPFPRTIKSLANSIVAISLFSTTFSTLSFPSKALESPIISTTTAPVHGLRKGRLLPCKTQSNCISSSSINSLDKYGRPWSFTKDPEDEYKEIVNLIQSDQYLKLVEKNDETRYIHAEAKSAVPPTGIDDVEFLINSDDKIITYRSNSREVIFAGFQSIGDGGSNQNRLDSIKRRLGVNEMEMSNEASEYLKKTENMQLINKMQMMSQPSDINFVDNSVPDTKISETAQTVPVELIP